MGKSKKNTRLVTLGDNAYSFYNAATGIQICKGEKKELTAHQLANTQIKRALHNGHLQYCTDNPVYTPSEEEVTEKLLKRFKEMVASGMEPKKISKAFKDEEVDKIAKTFELTRDEGESSESVIETIINLEN